MPAALPPGESPHFDHKNALPPQEGAHFCLIGWERLGQAGPRSGAEQPGGLFGRPRACRRRCRRASLRTSTTKTDESRRGSSVFVFWMGETRTGRSAERSRTARWAVRQAACVPAALPPGESPHFDHKKALPPQEGAHFCFIRWERLEWDVDFAGSIPVTPTKNYGLPSHFHGRPFSLSVAYQLLCSEKPGDRPLRGGIRFCYSMFSE